MSAILKEISDLPIVESHPIYQALIFRFPLLPITNKTNHKEAKSFLLLLMDVLTRFDDESDKSEEKAIIGYMKILGSLIHSYETEVYPISHGSGVEALKFLMEANGLTQFSFEDEIGQQPQVSRILSEERPLTRDHIERLAKRFNVSPALFF